MAHEPQGGKLPTVASLRLLIGHVLINDSDLDAFCQDHFPEVRRLFGDGMDRQRKVILLLDRAARGDIFARLSEDHAHAVARHKDCLRYDPGTAPAYADDRSEELERLYLTREQLLVQAGDTTQVDAEIRELRREMREGPQHHKGELLSNGRYRLVQRLGHGGFATVWKAYDNRNRVLVAVKVLHGQWSHDRSRVERFYRGARRMAQLSHPGIVRVVDEPTEESEFHFFVMEYLDGGDLRQAVLHQRISQADGLKVIFRIGAALEYAHQQKLIHRDVKPANILLDGAGDARLTDFDLVWVEDSTGGTRSGALGTFVYAAPEAMENAKEAGPQADIYSLAMTAVFVLYGNDLPVDSFKDTDRFIENLECSKELKFVLKRAVAWHIERRYQTMAEFCTSLSRVTRSNHRGPAAGGVVASMEVSKVSLMRRTYAVALMVIALLSLLGTGIIVRWLRPPQKTRVARPLLVSIPGQGILISQTEITQEQYLAVMGVNPSFFKGNKLPVESISWFDAIEYCNRLSTLDGLTPCYEVHERTVRWRQSACNGYRLPTEAEWVSAASATPATTYSGSDTLDDVGWYNENSQGRSHPVAEKKPNGFGLYDMSGNVWEWVWDETRFHDRFARGGSWLGDERYARGTEHGAMDPLKGYAILGFRISRSR